MDVEGFFLVITSISHQYHVYSSSNRQFLLKLCQCIVELPDISGRINELQIWTQRFYSQSISPIHVGSTAEQILYFLLTAAVSIAAALYHFHYKSINLPANQSTQIVQAACGVLAFYHLKLAP